MGFIFMVGPKLLNRRHLTEFYKRLKATVVYNIFYEILQANTEILRNDRVNSLLTLSTE